MARSDTDTVRTRTLPRPLGPGGAVALLLAVIGLGVSTYLTIEHYDSSVTLSCPESSTINCAKVTTSKWSHVGSVPVALLGLIFFVAMVALCLPVAWRVPALDRVRIAAAALGTLTVLGLIYIELFEVDAICLWCTAVHACTILLLGSVLWRSASEPAAG